MLSRVRKCIYGKVSQLLVTLNGGKLRIGAHVVELLDKTVFLHLRQEYPSDHFKSAKYAEQLSSSGNLD
ncbi:MAG: hypothetical protein WED33_06700 [Bacteroidia bacterium]